VVCVSILDTIDNAIADFGVSDDAMRWTPDAPAEIDDAPLGGVVLRNWVATNVDIRLDAWQRQVLEDLPEGMLRIQLTSHPGYVFEYDTTPLFARGGFVAGLQEGSCVVSGWWDAPHTEHVHVWADEVAAWQRANPAAAAAAAQRARLSRMHSAYRRRRR
jgi:hypothetical protein